MRHGCEVLGSRQFQSLFNRLGNLGDGFDSLQSLIHALLKFGVVAGLAAEQTLGEQHSEAAFPSGRTPRVGK